MRGIVAPPGMPADALAYWEGVFAKFVKTASWRKNLEDNLFEDGFQGSAELSRFIDQYSETTRGILREGGVKVVR